MDQLDAQQVAATILAAPLTTLLALTVRNPRLRQRAADRLAQAIVHEPQHNHPDQLTLPIA